MSLLRPGPLSFSLVLLALAGCVESAAEEIAQPSEAPEAPSDADLTTGNQGGIVGVVVDESFAPVGNATVALEGAGANPESIETTTTGADGKFSFGRLPPEAYRVTVTAELFAPTSQFVQVLAGEIAKVSFTLGAVASQQPYMELFIENGVAGCSFTAVWLIVGGPCSLVSPDTYATQFKIHLPESWRYAVFEAAWETNDAMWMYVDLDDDGTCISPGSPCPGADTTTSPARVDGAPGSAHGTDAYQHGDSKYPPEGEALDVWVNFSDFGLFYDQINEYGKPVCDANGYCGGVGTTVEIRFTMYASVFHYALPPVIEEYSAIPDA